VVTVITLVNSVECIFGVIFLDVRPRQLEMDGTLLRKAEGCQDRSGAVEAQVGWYFPDVCAGLVLVRGGTCLPAIVLSAGSLTAWAQSPVAPGMGIVCPHRKPGGWDKDFAHTSQACVIWNGSRQVDVTVRFLLHRVTVKCHFTPVWSCLPDPQQEGGGGAEVDAWPPASEGDLLGRANAQVSRCLL